MTSGLLSDSDPHSADALAHIRDEIEASREILTLREDPEDPSSAAYTEQVWTRAVQFLAKNAKWLWDACGKRMDAPAIVPGPNGSIDIHWDYPSYELLINIPVDAQTMAGFYGDDRGSVSIKGKFDPRTFNHGFLLWLTKGE